MTRTGLARWLTDSLPALGALLVGLVLIVLFWPFFVAAPQMQAFISLASIAGFSFVVGLGIRFLLPRQPVPNEAPPTAPARRTPGGKSGERPSPEGTTLNPGLIGFVTLLPALSALLLTSLLVWRSQLVFANLSDPQTLNSLALVALFGLAGLAVGYGVRGLVSTAATRVADDGDSNRSRGQIARWVVTAGTIGIFVTALSLIIAIAMQRVPDPNWKESALSIFTSVLPVFSTWVGTVLAFYFTNESFRQAAETSQSLTGAANPNSSEPITRPGTMIPFDRTIRYEMTSADIGGRDPKVAAEDLSLQKLKPLFRPPGIVRVIVFDDKKVPLYVLRDDAMQAFALTETLKTYLEAGTNKVAASNFAWTPATASIADAQRTIEIRRVTDLFVTEHGRSDEPTIGWVPDDNLAKG